MRTTSLSDAAATVTISKMNLERIAWIGTVTVAALIAVILFVEGYEGYGFVSIAIGLAASVNLFGHRSD